MSSLEQPSEKVWRSLEELGGTEGPVQDGQEFAQGASQPPDGPSRRKFLQLMAASAGLAGLTSCRWPQDRILPYARRPPEIAPGEPIAFATAMDIAGQGQGLLVTSYDGRPIKVEGNPLHPINQGTTDVFAQASVLDLYDADRSRNPVQTEGRSLFDRTWNQFDEFLAERATAFRQAQGRGLAILSEVSSSPSLADMRARLAKTYPQVRWYEYEPTVLANEQDGTVLAFGQPYRTHYQLDKARVVLSLDSDFVMFHPASLRYARDFIQSHTPAPEHPAMSRLYVVESTYSNTGAMADHRLAVPLREMWPIACRLAEMLGQAGLSLPAEAAAALRSQQGGGAESDKFLEAVARDLLAHRGQSAILVGAGQPAELHALGHLLNQALGNVGQTVWYSPQPQQQAPGLAALVREMVEGRVETLVILGGNPAYTAPADLDFAAVLAKVPTSIHLSMYWDETSRLCTWHLPQAHYLEAWDDVQSYDGTFSTAQPLIAPLYDGRSAIELLSQLAETPPLRGYEIVRRTVRERFAASMDDEAFEAFWRSVLNNGVVADSGLRPVQPSLQTAALAERFARVARPARPLGADNLEIVFKPDPTIFDGRFANNVWLQELPHTMTKIAWDNAALVSPATAAALGIEQQQVVRLRRAGREVLAPVYILPGQADWSVTVHLGYGRRDPAGQVGRGVGFNAYTLRTTEAMHFADGLATVPTGRKYAFAQTQDHWRIDGIGRAGTEHRLTDLVREVSLVSLQAGATEGGAAASEEQRSLWQEFQYNHHRWGMAIDMNRCIGCNACVIACQAENNVPVVGRDQVRRQREMQWLRIDRYFRGQAEAPQVTFQPMFCVHCETAPCEGVCPVAATLHDSDGLNLMVYNRCVGTRYCSNNCPYKVRRFNFYHYTKDTSRLRAMLNNPDVTVRSRGVMEKCTYCVQRIQRAKIAAKNERRPIPDGAFTTACAQVCPTKAIVFGDLNNPDSEVARLQRQPRAYAVLRELNTKPRSLHMARVRNPNPELSIGADHADDRHG